MGEASSSPQAVFRPPHVALVCGDRTIDHLGPIIRHLVIGLLDEPMQVSLICPSRQCGPGIPRHGLPAEPDVVAGEGEGSLHALHLPSPPVGIHAYDMPWLPPLRRKAMEELAEEFADSNPSLLHALDVDALPATVELAERLDLPYVVWAYSCCREFPGAEPRCRAVLAASEPVQRAALQAGVPAEKLHLLRPGVYQARSATCFVTASHAAAIVAAGSLDEYTPVEAALKTFAALKAAQRQCVFFLVGNGKAERHLRRQAERLDLMDELTFVDWTGPEQLTDIIKAADLFVWPAPTDRVNIELLSAMAGGVPVLVAGGGVGDFIIPDQTALTFAPGDSAQLTSLLSSLLDNHALARELAERALAHLRANHSPARMVGSLAGIYRAILKL